MNEWGCFGCLFHSQNKPVKTQNATKQVTVPHFGQQQQLQLRSKRGCLSASGPRGHPFSRKRTTIGTKPLAFNSIFFSLVPAISPALRHLPVLVRSGHGLALVSTEPSVEGIHMQRMPNLCVKFSPGEASGVHAHDDNNGELQVSPAAVATNGDAVSIDTTSVNKSYVGDLRRKHSL